MSARVQNTLFSQSELSYETSSQNEKFRLKNLSVCPNQTQNYNFLHVTNIVTQYQNHSIKGQSLGYGRHVPPIRQALTKNWIQKLIVAQLVKNHSPAHYQKKLNVENTRLPTENTNNVIISQKNSSLIFPKTSTQSPVANFCELQTRYSDEFETFDPQFMKRNSQDRVRKMFIQKLNNIQISKPPNLKPSWSSKTANDSNKTNDKAQRQKTVVVFKKEGCQSSESQRMKETVTLSVQLNKKKIVIEKSMLQLISAKNFVIMCQVTETVVFGRKCHRPREVASLTKIMTCLVVFIFILILIFNKACRMIKNMELDSKDFKLNVSRKAVTIFGTTANLKQGDDVSLLDLLYGMMLPSGNDAAFAVAEGLGRLIKHDQSLQLSSHQAVRFYLIEMNRIAMELKLQDTNYANPHGLANSDNYSSAYDQAILIQEAMKDELFAQIVGTLSYKCIVHNKKSLTQRDLLWENTNKLLSRKDCLGVKTGTTPSAGACLAANFHSPTNSQNKLIIVVLRASGCEERFTEMIHLYEYTKRKIMNS